LNTGGQNGSDGEKFPVAQVAIKPPGTSNSTSVSMFVLKGDLDHMVYAFRGLISLPESLFLSIP